MTLRQLLTTVDLPTVYALINKRDRKIEHGDNKPSLDVTKAAYSRVVEELLGKPKVKAYSMPILVRTSVDPFDNTTYTDICLLNRRYVAPPDGAKPWGGKNPPKGHYNCNLAKHNRTYSMMGTRWSKLIDTPVVNEAGCSNEQMAACILWELTFDGWTEEKAVEKTNAIFDRIKEAMKDIDEGKVTEIPPKKKGGFKIVIPDTVSKQIADIVKKKKKKK